MDTSQIFRYYPVMLHIVAVLMAGTVIKLLYDMLIRTQRLKKSWDELYEQLQDEHLIRKEEIEKQQKLQGEAFQVPALEQLDRLIAYSGIQRQFRGFNGIFYILLSIVLASVAAIMAVVLSGSFLCGLVAAATALLLPYMILKVKANLQYEATKRDFTTFMRMFTTYSGIYKDVLTILDAASQHTGNPIRYNVKAAVTIGRAEGNPQKALKWLWDNMEYRLFKDLIKALEITSRNTLEYRKVIEKYMLISEKTNSSMEKQKVIVRKGRMEVITMLALGIGMFYMVLVSVNGSGGMMQGISLFLGNPLGKLILGYLLAVVLGSLWYIFFKMRCE